MLLQLRCVQKKAKKAAKEALDVARKKLKHKGKVMKERKAKVKKKAMRLYFQSSRGARAGQPLSLVFDGSLPEVPGAKPNFQEIRTTTEGN